MGNAVQSTRTYHFETFVLDARTGELSQSGRRIPLRDQSVQLLLALLEHPGELVTREELARRLWGTDTFVDFDRGLNKVVNHLREALEDSAEQPRFIETLPRKGYRFIAPVSDVGDDAEDVAAHAATARSRFRRWLSLSVTLAIGIGIAVGVGIGEARRWMANRSAAARISALAVMPLENLSRDPEQQYFADGLTDTLIPIWSRPAPCASPRVRRWRATVKRRRASKKSGAS